MKNPLEKSSRYVSVAETAALLRAALKREWPETKFSVRSESYSGGASINVKYRGGPKRSAVEALAKSYEGSGFDGMIDLKYYVSTWLYADGTVSRASSPGTESSRGMDSGYCEDPIPGNGAELVHFAADHVFVEREATPEEYWAQIAAIEAMGHEVRHHVYEASERVRTDKKVGRYWRHEWKSLGPKLSRIHQVESLANGWDAMPLARVIHENSHCIFEKGRAPEMTETEREERRKYGMADTASEAAAFENEFDRMVALIEGR